jgi:TIR domain/SIR2-like domain
VSVTVPPAQAPPLDDIFWDDLLYAIGEGKVVPIVGRDLLVVDTDRGPRPFYLIVAERLAAQLRVPADSLPASFDMNAVACAYKERNGDPSDVNAAVARVLRNLDLPAPEPLKLLAEIPNFKVFISTTIDSLLSDAIAAVRGARPAVVAFPAASDLLDFDESLVRAHGSLVFHILGLVSSSSPFAVTEGQILEQMHEVMTSTARPERLIAKLQQSHLLMLGVDFPDWPARFLLRFTRDKPLWDSRNITEVFADPRALEADFSRFLHYFSTPKSTIYPGGSSVAFVRELHRRWLDQTGGRVAPAPADEVAPWIPGSIFVSYAAEDRTAAFHLADELTKAGLEVWVDRRLTPGDRFDNIIGYHVRECCAFVAVLSQNTNREDGPGRYFREEWALARDLNKRFTGTDRRFLFPVVVDDTPPGEINAIRRDVFSSSAVRAQGGAPPPELTQQLDLAQKAHRKQLARV